MLEINKVYEQCCFEGIKQIDDNSIDLCIIDPPYYIENLKKDLRNESSLRKSSKNNIFFNEFDHFESLDDFKAFINNVLIEVLRVLKPMKQCYMFVSYYHLDWVISAIKGLNFRYYKPLIWYKRDTMGLFPNQYGCNYEVFLWFRKKGEGNYVNNIGCGQRDVFDINSTLISGRKDAGFHPTPKPKKLIRQLILNSSNENDLVLDMFMGSGTTAICSKETNRKFIGFEKNADYMKIINKRLSQNTLNGFFIRL